MNYHQLAVVCSIEHGLSFQLLIDGQTLHALVGAKHGAIPHWEIEGSGLPAHWSNEDPHAQTGWRIVSVFECGESGCGHTRAWVEDKGESIDWTMFAGEVAPEKAHFLFQFSVTQYHEVMLKMSILAKTHREVKQ